jgi:hypothetical protein
MVSLQLLLEEKAAEIEVQGRASQINRTRIASRRIIKY